MLTSQQITIILQRPTLIDSETRREVLQNLDIVRNKNTANALTQDELYFELSQAWKRTQWSSCAKK